MSRYLRNVITGESTPQTEPILGHELRMAKNNASGYSFALDPFKQLERFLILGSEGGSYYVSERKLTAENSKIVLECARIDADRTMRTIVGISIDARAPKNDPAIFALALIASQTKDPAFDRARAIAFQCVNDVCRIGTHLFQFIDYCNALRGWGRALRTSVKNYYSHKGTKGVSRLAYDLVKYQSRERWAHRDLLRLAHIKDASLNAAFRWASKGEFSDSLKATAIDGFERAKKATDAADVARLITEFDLTREMVPTQFLSSKAVWAALFENMPMTAMLRNLNKMTNVGLLGDNSDATIRAMRRMTDAAELKEARIHPLNILTAWMTYKSGAGNKGSLTWTPSAQIVSALEDAYYLSFDAVESTGKRFMLGIDVSDSMTWNALNGIPGFTPRVASSCMAMVSIRTEPVAIVKAFSTGLQDIGLTKRDSLEDAISKTERMNACGTDCAQPMLWATQNKVPVDVFAIYTDSETWAGAVHPKVALEQYRQKTGINAGLMVVGMQSNGFSIADPLDSKSVDVVGFDTTVPQVLTWLANS